jgi:hypothetical protein
MLCLANVKCLKNFQIELARAKECLAGAHAAHLTLPIPVCYRFAEFRAELRPDCLSIVLSALTLLRNLTERHELGDDADKYLAYLQPPYDELPFCTALAFPQSQ